MYIVQCSDDTQCQYVYCIIFFTCMSEIYCPSMSISCIYCIHSSNFFFAFLVFCLYLESFVWPPDWWRGDDVGRHVACGGRRKSRGAAGVARSRWGCNQTWQAGEMPIDVSSSCNGKILENVDRTIQISADPFALEHRFLFVWASLLNNGGTPQVLLQKPVENLLFFHQCVGMFQPDIRGFSGWQEAPLHLGFIGPMTQYYMVSLVSVSN